MLAVARPGHMIFAGETIELDATRSWTARGNIRSFDWTFKGRAFYLAHGEEVWDFGDGTPKVKTKSDGNVKLRADTDQSLFMRSSAGLLYG